MINTAVYSLSNILNAAIPFLLLPILTRVLVPSEYGVIAMYNSSMGILGAFTGLSVNGAVNSRFVDRNKIDFPSYVGSSLFVLLTSTVSTLLIIIIFIDTLSAFTSTPPFWLLLATVTSGCNFLVQVRLGIWLMEKKPAAYGSFQVALTIVNVSLSLIFVLLMKQGYEGRLWGQSLALIVFGIIGIFSLKGSGWIKFKPRIGYIKEGLSFGIPLIPHTIGGAMITLADRFIINKQLNIEAAGIYMVATQIGMGMYLLSDAFNKAFVPWLYENLSLDKQTSKIDIVKGTWCYFVIALAIAGLIALFSYWIVLFVAGNKYVTAAPALAWLAVGQAFVGMYLMVTNYIFFMRKTKLLAWVTVFSGTIGLTSTWILTPILGITGAGISFAFAMALRFTLTWMLSHRIYPMPWFFFLNRANKSIESTIRT